MKNVDYEDVNKFRLNAIQGEVPFCNATCMIVVYCTVVWSVVS